MISINFSMKLSTYPFLLIFFLDSVSLPYSNDISKFRVLTMFTNLFFHRVFSYLLSIIQIIQHISSTLHFIFSLVFLRIKCVAPIIKFFFHLFILVTLFDFSPLIKHHIPFIIVFIIHAISHLP